MAVVRCLNTFRSQNIEHDLIACHNSGQIISCMENVLI